MTKYYKVKFSMDAKEIRMRILWSIESVSILDCDEYVIVICDEEDCNAVEYELRKAERRDDYCIWKKK